MTTVCGRLGESLKIGGLGQDRQDERTVLLGRSTGSVDDNRRVLLKVEELK